MKENIIYQSGSTERYSTPKHISELLGEALERYYQATGNERYMRLSERIHRPTPYNR